MNTQYTFENWYEEFHNLFTEIDLSDRKEIARAAFDRAKDGKLVKLWVPKFKVGDRVQMVRGTMPGIVREISEEHKTVRVEWSPNGIQWEIESGLEPYVWSLSRHIPGFRPLREGEEWFDNGWREELLPDGYRPLLRGELPLTGDEYDVVFHPVGWSVQTGTGWILVEKHPNLFHRTRRPLPEPPKLVALGPEDVPPGSAISDSDGREWRMLTAADSDRVFFDVNESETYRSLMDKQILRPGQTEWQPCHKPA